MKKILSLIILLSLSTLNHAGVITQHFIVIGCDGMSPDGIRNAQTPVLDEMLQNGASTFSARAVLPTSSSPNWASMLMGAGPEQHGITSNNWEKDDHTLPPVIAGADGMFPTIFSLLKTQKKPNELGAIYHWDGFGRLFEKKCVDYDRHGETEDVTKDLIVDYIRQKKPDFLFIQFDHVDGAGHKFGHGTTGYFQAIEKADKLIGDVVQATRDAGIFNATTFLVIADHGGIGYGHGGETIEELEIPFILYGKGVKKGFRIKQPVYVYDTAATVAFALGVDQPYAWIGRPVKCAFTGYESPEVFNEKVMLPAPVIYPGKKLYNPAGGFFVDEFPEMKIESAVPGAEIRYTLDGSEPTPASGLYATPVTIKKSGVVKAKLFKSPNEESPVAVAYFRIAQSQSNNGVNFKYYEAAKLQSLPDFAQMTAVDSGRTFQIRSENLGRRPDHIAFEFDGFIKLETDGEYRFYTNSDDGSKLYINNEEIVDNGGDHGMIERSGTVNLTPGLHAIKVIYFNGGGGSWLDVYYKGPGIPKQIIPPDVLYIRR